LRFRTVLAVCGTALWAAASCMGPFPADASRAYSDHFHKSHAARLKAIHLAHLAAREKAAWRLHLAKVRDLPHHQRLLIIRHDRRYKEKLAETHDVHQAHLERLADQEKHAWRVHLAKLHLREARDRRIAVHSDSRHDRVLADHQAYLARLAAQEKHAWHVHLAKLQARDAHDHAGALHQAFLVHLAAQEKAAWRVHLAKLALRQAQAHLLAVRAQQQRFALQARHAHALTQHQEIAAQHLALRKEHWLAAHQAAELAAGKSIRLWQRVAAGVPVKGITVNLNDPNVKISAVMSRWGEGTSEPFRQMINRADPNVAVTGTFFSLNNLQPVGDIVIDGSLIHFGGMGTALCITPYNHARMVQCQWGRHHDWSSYDFVLACGPRLLHRGRVDLDPVAQRFHDHHMFAPNSRIAVGITRSNHIIFVMTHDPIYLGRLAKVMQAVGASEAMNLDAGASNGFYYNGDILARPGRKLTNMIVVYDRRSQYERELPQLVPSAYRRMSDAYAPRRFGQRLSDNETVASLHRSW
jgi:hypothetical protein